MMLFFLLISGLLGIILGFLGYNQLTNKETRLGQCLDSWITRPWFQNPWICGIILFFFNAVLFSLVLFLTFVSIFVATRFSVPVPVYLYAPLAVAASIVVWLWLGRSWKGLLVDRLKIAFVGSSFYFILGIYAAIRLWTLKPDYPGDDTFMAAVGIILLLIISLIAASTCLISVWISGKA